MNIGIENKSGKLRLRLPRSVAAGSARYLSTRLESTPENFKRVQVVAWQIEEELRSGNFDSTLERYAAAFRLPTISTIKPVKEPDLLTLWGLYCDHRKNQVESTTFQREYLRKFPYHIGKLPTKEVSQAVVICEFLLKTVSADTTKRVLTRLSACCNWAVKSGLVQKNYFAGMAAEIKLTKNYADTIDPFSLAERNEILKAFEEHPSHKHYLPFVRFLFLTGCRTGEAIGLQWRHISSDCTQVTFCESYDSGLKIRKDTKNHKARKFPCNPVLQKLLCSIKPLLALPEELVFKSHSGLPINNSKFTTQVWKGCRAGKKVYRGIVTGLVAEGKVERYRCTYNTRHTFITMALEAGLTAPQVARLVGNSPEVIMRHYAGSALKSEVPVM